jgi:hypothetical protein
MTTRVSVKPKVLASGVYTGRLGNGLWPNHFINIKYGVKKDQNGRKVKRFEIAVGQAGEGYKPHSAIELDAAGSYGGIGPAVRFIWLDKDMSVAGFYDVKKARVEKFATPGSRYSEIYSSDYPPLAQLEKILGKLVYDITADEQDAKAVDMPSHIQNLRVLTTLLLDVQVELEKTATKKREEDRSLKGTLRRR